MASRQLLRITMAILGLAISCEISEAASKKMPLPPPRFPFKIDPMTPLADLLPPAPETIAARPSVLNEDLTKVPELMFARPLAKDLDFLKSQEETAHRMAKINHLNKGNVDGFMKAFLAKRDDLRGMPFLMGKDCRTEEQRAAVFLVVVRVIRHNLEAVQFDESLQEKKTPPSDQVVADFFWSRLAQEKRSDKKDLLPDDDETLDSLMNRHVGLAEPAVVAALMQMITPMAEPYQLGLAKYLTSIKHADATRALAKLALYAPEERVRTAAIEGLKSRPSKESLDVLLAGFRYPLSAVSKRAAETLVKTQNKEALSQLVDVLEQPDPRAPATKQVDGKQVSFVREMVRVNHHHNCLLCHAPANTSDVPKGVLSAPVPQPSQPLPSVLQGYGSRQSPDIFVRTDMNYLRQDFSMMMEVENAKPWPEMQRFDFFVRTRQVTPAEASDITKMLAKQTPPNHLAAQYALRELTGRTPTDGTAQAWRRILNLTN